VSSFRCFIDVIGLQNLNIFHVIHLCAKVLFRGPEANGKVDQFNSTVAAILVMHARLSVAVYLPLLLVVPVHSLCVLFCFSRSKLYFTSTWSFLCGLTKEVTLACTHTHTHSACVVIGLSPGGLQSIALRMFICLSVCLSVCLCVCVCVYMSVVIV